jgi:argininosuccinate lyase
VTLWNKGTGTDPEALRFSAGDEYRLDRRLVEYDCKASRAHARMLGKIGVLGDDEVAGLCEGLEEIEESHARGEFEIAPEQEDCHTAIEEWLTSRVGEAGKKIHLGRSRNDQVLAALRLYEKDALAAVRERLGGLAEALATAIERHGDVEMPGYTHVRPAMPTTVGTSPSRRTSWTGRRWAPARATASRCSSSIAR